MRGPLAFMVESVREPLAELGFKKRAGAIFTSDLGDDVLGWLGLNTASEHVIGVEVAPVVGVRHGAVERLVAELRGDPYHPYRPPTIRTQLGYLTTERRYRAWPFDGPSNEASALDLVATLLAVGLPFFRTNASLEKLCLRLDEGLSSDHALPYRRAAAWWLVGDRERARSLVDEALAALGAERSLAADDFRRFAGAFRARS